jgi:hypothetical protein
MMEIVAMSFSNALRKSTSLKSEVRDEQVGTDNYLFRDFDGFPTGNMDRMA